LSDKNQDFLINTNILLFVAIVTAGDRVPDEQLLFQDLMVGYEKSVRPVINSSTVLTVTLGLKLNQIVDLVSFPS
jgi:hypothetical protein